MTTISFLFSIYLTARFVEVVNRVVVMTEEMNKRAYTFLEYRLQTGIPRALSARVQHYLQSRFHDILEVRKEPEKAGLISELPLVLRKEVLRRAYTNILCLNRFFAQLNRYCLAELCVVANKNVYVRGEAVRTPRECDVDARVWYPPKEGIRFLYRGGLHSERIYQVYHKAPYTFDEDALFTLPENFCAQVLSLYAVEYTEVVALSRESVTMVLCRYPKILNRFVKIYLQKRWQTMSKLIIGCNYKSLVVQDWADHSGVESTAARFNMQLNRQTSLSAKASANAARRTLVDPGALVRNGTRPVSGIFGR
jgi:hypothetical protein